ncbi:MAG: hypothetical protein H6740_16810 [Alphaproteobacteria bacterium]|nr:hypothetical protein [Alphaproteobacteria bacterium]
MSSKTWLILGGLLLAAGGAYLGAAHLSGGAFPTPGLALGGELGELRRTTLAFWEDIQFKDFDKAASYHAADIQDDVDIPFLLERVFLQKPEMLDFMDFEILMAEVDSSGLRARVKTRVKVKDLAREKVDDREVMLFYKRESLDAPWIMELESSLRQLQADKKKKH